MKRTSLPKRKTPLKRSAKPIKRVAMRRTPTKRKQAIDRTLTVAKDFYFSTHGQPADRDWARCQKCHNLVHRTECAAHHKLKRSLGGKHDMGNLVILHHLCHALIHNDPVELKRVKESRANAENGGMI